MAYNVNTITAITNALYHGKMEKLWMTAHPAWRYLHAKGPKLQGGERIKTDLIHAQMDAEMFADGAEFVVNRKEFIAAVFNEWRQGVVKMLYTGKDRLRNAGAPAVYSHVKAMVSNGVETFAKTMTDQLYKNGAIGANDINSLDVICNDLDNQLGCGTTFGDIDKATETALAGTIHSGGGVNVVPDYNLHSAGWAEVHYGLRHPDVILEHNKILHLFMRSQQPQQQFGSEKTLDAGFFAIRFNKMATIFGDPNAPFDIVTHTNNRIYMLNMGNIDLVSHKDENMRMEPFVRLQKQDAYVGYYLWAGNLVSDGPKFHCVIYNFDCDKEPS